MKKVKIDNLSKEISDKQDKQDKKQEFINNLYEKQFNPTNLKKKEINKLKKKISLMKEKKDYHWLYIKHRDSELTLDEIVCQLKFKDSDSKIEVFFDKFHDYFVFQKNENEKKIYLTKVYFNEETYFNCDYLQSSLNSFEGSLIPVKEIDNEFIIQKECTKEEEGTKTFNENELIKEFLENKEFVSILTFHTYGYVLFFKPSIKEVRSLIPITNEFDKLYLNTRPASMGPGYHMDAYHVAVTKIFID